MAGACFLRSISGINIPDLFKVGGRLLFVTAETDFLQRFFFR